MPHQCGWLLEAVGIGHPASELTPTSNGGFIFYTYYTDLFVMPRGSNMQEPRHEDFNAIEAFLVRYGIDIGFLISGFFGALLLVSKNSAQKISTTIASILSGAACANYLTPVVMNHVPDSIKLNGKYAVAFIMGFLGLKGLELILNKLFVKLEVKSKEKPKIEKKKSKSTKKSRKD